MSYVLVQRSSGSTLNLESGYPTCKFIYVTICTRIFMELASASGYIRPGHVASRGVAGLRFGRMQIGQPHCKPNGRCSILSFSELVGVARYQTIVHDGDITIAKVRVRAVLPPLPKPLQTASGQLTHASILLIDLEMSSGAVGVSYLFSPRQDMLKPMIEIIHALVASVTGLPCDPVAICEQFDRQFLLFGGTGVVTMARAAIDMAMWDTIAKHHGEPLYRLLGGTSEPIKAYESSGLGLSNAAQVAEEAVSFVNNGFDTMKVRLGYPEIRDDELVLDAVRSAVGDHIGLMVDYNQALTFEQALDRCSALERFHLLWIEEPLHAADLEGAAKIAHQVNTPIQLGENLFSQHEVERAISLGSSKYLMPDVMKIGGATDWLVAATRADQNGIPISSHLFPEISAHLLACAPNRHFLEYVNWTDAILVEPVKPRNGHVTIPDHPGIGLSWNEKAVAQFQLPT